MENELGLLGPTKDISEITMDKYYKSYLNLIYSQLDW